MGYGILGNDSKKLQFHCSMTGEIVTTDDCSECIDAMKCDIHATMLDEERDR